MACPNATTNPVAIPIQSGATLDISCNAHASFIQQVVLSFNPDMSNEIGTFQGSGENVPMNPQNGIQVPTGSNSTLFAQFNFQPQGGPLQKAGRVCAPVFAGRFTTVASEDGADSDDNDSYLMIYTPASPSAKSPY